MLIFIGCLCLSVIFCLVIFMDAEDDHADITFRRIFLFGVLFFIIFECANFNSRNFKLYTGMKIDTTVEYIYSLNSSDKIYGSFILGSGTIGNSSQYSYFIQNEDGSKQKKSIQTDGTKIFEGVTNIPAVEIIKCTSAEQFSFFKGYFETTEEKCEKLIERKIFVPNNTIILEYNVK